MDEFKIQNKRDEARAKPLYYFKNFYWSIVDLQYCAVSGVQQSEAVIHISIPF